MSGIIMTGFYFLNYTASNIRKTGQDIMLICPCHVDTPYTPLLYCKIWVDQVMHLL